ncbi:MAG: phosphonate ABC transporter, permease protein PhnE [Nitrospinota bacterium]
MTLRAVARGEVLGRRGGVSLSNLLLALAALSLFAWSYRGVAADLPGLLGGEVLRQLWEYFSRLWPPALGVPFLSRVAWGVLETLAISLFGTFLAVALALPLAFAGARTLTAGALEEVERGIPAGRLIRGGLFLGARLLLALFRAVPELLWAILFILAAGLGPFPGTLALGVHTGGVLGKLYAEALEEVPRGAIEALRASGVGRVAVLFYGVLPQALPQLLSYTLYRWEVNIRAATILGFVGAGGLGQELHVAIQLFLENRLLTLLIVIFLLVTAVDGLSARLRRRVLAREG